jgi:hypothetical protein
MRNGRKVRSRKRQAKTAHFSEMPFWILIVSDADCIELRKKDKPDDRRKITIAKADEK